MINFSMSSRQITKGLGLMHLMLLALAMLVPRAAFAHTGDHGGFSAGFGHPFLGWDHLVVMVAVGLWAAQTRRWWLPIAFVGVLALGAGAALLGVAVPGLESFLLGSTIAFAGLVLFKVQGPAIGSFAVVGLFAFLHGFAHGAEMPADSAAVAFVPGFLAASLVLHVIGYAAGTLISRSEFCRKSTLSL